MAPTVNPNVLSTQPDPNIPNIPAVTSTSQPTAIVSQPAPTLPPLPKQTFKEGFAAGGTHNYTTDAEGNRVDTTPPRRASMGGILGQVLRGALEGATRGMAAQAPEGARGYGAAASAAAKAAEEGRITADLRAKAQAQQQFENNQKAVQAKLQNNLMAVQTRNLVQKSQFDKEEHAAYMESIGIKNKTDAAQFWNLDEQQRNLEAELQADLEAGIGPAYATLTQTPQNGKSMAGQAMPHANAIVNNQALAVHNGKTGDQNGVGLWHKPSLQTPLDKPVPVPSFNGAVSDGTSKDNLGNTVPKGQYIPTWTMYSPGVNPTTGKPTTWEDVAHQFKAAHGQIADYQKREAAQMANTAKAAEIKETGARTQLTKAQADLAEEQAIQIKKLGADTPPAGYQPSPNVISMNPTQLSQSLNQQGIKTPADFQALYAIGHYDADIKSLAQKQYRGVPGRSQEAAIEYIRTYINPNWRQTNYEAVQKLDNSFANPQLPAAGGQMIAFNTGTRHLGQLYTAAQDRQNGQTQLLNKIALNLGTQVGATPQLTFNSIREALVGELGKTFKGSSVTDQEAKGIEDTISSSQSPAQAAQVARTYAHLMLSKASALTQDYVAYTGHLPPNAIDPETMKVYQSMGIDPSTAFPEGAQILTGGTENQNPVQTPVTMTPTRPTNIPLNYIFKPNGPHGMGWYNPATLQGNH